MANAESVDQPFQRDGPPFLDRIEQVSRRGLAIAVTVLQLGQRGLVARLQKI
jgi:hypothetical protein